MDDSDFDLLAKRLAARLDRRTLTAALGVAFAGVGLVAVGDAADAKGEGKRHRGKHGGRDGGDRRRGGSGGQEVAPAKKRKCKNGTTKCGKKCRDLTSDPEHCGDCGHACDPGQTCEASACAGGCADCVGDLGCYGENHCTCGPGYAQCPGGSNLCYESRPDVNGSLPNPTRCAWDGSTSCLDCTEGGTKPFVCCQWGQCVDASGAAPGAEGTALFHCGDCTRCEPSFVCCRRPGSGANEPPACVPPVSGNLCPTS